AAAGNPQSDEAALLATSSAAALVAGEAGAALLAGAPRTLDIGPMTFAALASCECLWAWTYVSLPCGLGLTSLGRE
ncbi:MAG: hypothetical protein ACRC1H_18450, partial [Caldilineaceae bacterium]